MVAVLSGRTHTTETTPLMREVPLKVTEKAQLLAERFGGRVFRFEAGSHLGAIALDRWTQPVQLRLVEGPNGYELVARDA